MVSKQFNLGLKNGYKIFFPEKNALGGMRMDKERNFSEQQETAGMRMDKNVFSQKAKNYNNNYNNKLQACGLTKHIFQQQAKTAGMQVEKNTIFQKEKNCGHADGQNT